MLQYQIDLLRESLCTFCMLFISPQEAGTEISSTQLCHQYFFPISVMFLVKPSLHIAAIMIAFKKSLVRIYLQKWMLHKDYDKWTLLKMCKFDYHPEILFCHNDVML
jgi:hypothetical protein